MNVEKVLFNQQYAKMQRDGKLMYLGFLLQRGNELFPDRVALICRSKEITYKELFYRASLMSSVLRARGIKARDRVLLLYENSIEFYIAYFAVLQAGAIIAPLNIFLHERELTHIVNDCKPALIITSSEHLSTFAPSAGTIPIITEAEIGYDTPVPADFVPGEITELAADEMAALLYTSGTTGFPKGVMLSSRNIMTNVAQGITRLNLSRERMLGVLPLFHSFAQNGCIWSALFCGATVIVVPRIERRYILEGLRHKPTLVLGVPALFGLFCMMKTAPLEGVNYFISGGDALPDKIRAAFALLYRRTICNGYGLTETSPIVSANMADEMGPTNSVGPICPGIDYQLRDEQGKPVPSDQVGVLWLRGDNIMMGYYNAPELTAQTIVDGWLITGDLATFDAKNNLIICGRYKDLIIHKGVNIYPQEIENVVLTHSAVILAGVIGKDDEVAGQIPIAFVQLREPVAGIEEQLRTLCAENLAPYKIPKKFIVVDEMPLTTTKKVDKKVLRKMV
jgi:long-chain acyl-CoA synthetase